MCECIQRANEMFKEHNMRIVTPMTIDDKRRLGPLPKATILTERLDKKKRGNPMSLVATFCPFCGVKYDAGKDEDVEVIAESKPRAKVV